MFTLEVVVFLFFGHLPDVPVFGGIKYFADEILKQPKKHMRVVQYSLLQKSPSTSPFRECSANFRDAGKTTCSDTCLNISKFPYSNKSKASQEEELVQKARSRLGMERGAEQQREERGNKRQATLRKYVIFGPMTTFSGKAFRPTKSSMLGLQETNKQGNKQAPTWKLWRVRGSRGS